MQKHSIIVGLIILMVTIGILSFQIGGIKSDLSELREALYQLQNDDCNLDSREGNTSVEWNR